MIEGSPGADGLDGRDLHDLCDGRGVSDVRDVRDVGIATDELLLVHHADEFFFSINLARLFSALRLLLAILLGLILTFLTVFEVDLQRVFRDEEDLPLLRLLLNRQRRGLRELLRLGESAFLRLGESANVCLVLLALLHGLEDFAGFLVDRGGKGGGGGGLVQFEPEGLRVVNCKT